MQTVGLVAAMPQEGKALLKQVGGWEKLTIGGFRAYRFTESGWECRLIESGMGAKRAADATRALIKAGRPQLLISFGIAGAVEEDLQIGDVVAAESTCMLQGNELTAVQPLGKVTQPAWEAISAALKKEGVRLFRGTAITTRGSQWTGWQPGRPEHPVLEMETPLVVLRAISDGPAAPIPFDLASMMDEDYNLRIGRIIGAILRRPNLLRQALRMGKNSEIAARNAAMAVEVLLSFQVPIR
jgi:adenosylhomocysteine nucleosidase